VGLIQDKDRDKIFFKREQVIIKHQGDYVTGAGGKLSIDGAGAYKTHRHDVRVVSSLFNFDGQSRRFVKRYLVAFEVLSILAMLSMGCLLYAAMTPAQGEGLFVDVVSGKIFALVGKNMF